MDLTCLPVSGPPWFQAAERSRDQLHSLRFGNFTLVHAVSVARVHERARALSLVLLLLCVHSVLFTNVFVLPQYIKDGGEKVLTL